MAGGTTTTNHSFAVGPGWKGLLAEVGVEHSAVLRRAGLPDDFLNQPNPRLTPEGFLRFSEALEVLIPDPGFWVKLTDAMSPEWFSPPVFAALCSPDLTVAAQRLSLFKPLIAPMTLDVAESGDGLELRYRWKRTALKPPASLHGMEALFITKLARLGTRERVRPTRVRVPELPPGQRDYEAFLGVRIHGGSEAIEISFSSTDARRPFLTANPAMWSIFEPELRKRLADLEGNATFESRTRAVLIEALPSGQTEMDKVARRLGVSGRTLQRRLREEDTSFKEVVRSTREGFARHYLRRTNLTSTEIAYLLGFEEPTSFFRAFHRWTGSTPEQLRRSAQDQPPPGDPPPGYA